MSQALQMLTALGAEPITYTPHGQSGKTLTALVERRPVRVNAVGTKEFLTNTVELWIVNSPSEGVTEIKERFDAVTLVPNLAAAAEQTLQVSRILEQDEGVPGDGVGVWHLEAVA